MLRFTVLGEVRAWRGDVELDLGPKQRQAVLAVLLLARGRAVSTNDLVDYVWGDRTTPSAVNALRNHVLELRRVLEPAWSADRPRVLVRAPGGYAICVPRGAVDVELIDVGSASGAPAEIRERLAVALGLWTGTPLAGLPGPYAERVRAHLVERRLSLLERRIEAELALGLCDEALGELHLMCAEHPLRESIRALLMSALCRTGRRAEALAVYADTRRNLIQELGIEPGRQLSDLHGRILRGEVDLDGTPDTAVVPIRKVEIATRGKGPTFSTAQLPADINDFTGRADNVEQVGDQLRGSRDSVPVCVIRGMAGIGKSALAVHVAHRVREHFPDGQLYLDLRGDSTENGARPRSLDAVGDCLRSFGFRDEEIARTLAQRSAQLRSHLDGKRVLIVLDNARNAEQVIPLVPGSGGCAVLITSRSAMPELAGALSTWLDVPTEGEAMTLLSAVIGVDRVAAERDSASQLVRACGCLPLAVRIAGARLNTRRGWSIGFVAERMADVRQRLGLLRVGDLDLRAAFQAEQGRLDSAQTRAFRVLAPLGARGFSVEAAAVSLGVSREEAERQCESLVDLSLLETSTASRYHYHDLLRLFALEPENHGAVPSCARVA